MFKENKYTKWYWQIISNPDLSGYTERHHIIPRSLGGSNQKENIIKLSVRQHFVCHLLLTKMLICSKSRGKMCWALKCMLRVRTVDGHRYIPKSSKIFELTRRAHTGILRSDEAKQKLSNARKGKTFSPHSIETRNKIGASQRGKIVQKDTREKLSAALLGKPTWMKGKTHTVDSKIRMSESQKKRIRRPASKHSTLAIENNRRAQQKYIYTIADPHGILFQTSDMKNFCLVNDLPYQRLVDKSLIGKPIKDSGHIRNKNHVGWVTLSAELKESVCQINSESG